LYASGYETVKNWPWSYGCFNNGVPIPDIGREIYRESAELQRRYPNPFSTSGGDNYFAWLNSDVQLQTEKPLVTQLWYQVYKARKDLQEAFHDISGADREAFTGWIAKYGSKEYQIDTAWNVKCRAS
jgi:hypothetical protein